MHANHAAKPCGVALHEPQAAFDADKIRLTVKTMISLALTSRTCPQARCDEIVRGISFGTFRLMATSETQAAYDDG